ncbi:tetraspanin-11 isoform X3 [Symphalangus syndactylus]|uniref:tetraspanin-11 isoform X3 n=1 Tax=Symphalangus syndactylus TaxID=9590 RepID=UPI002442C726|nr:tetraspanin-11 isoform X3 [Symphalangus syndactylus]
MARYKTEQDDWLIIYLKYLLFVFNFFFWVGGAAVLAVGIWTLVEKSGYLSVLASSTFAASAYILIFAGVLVMVTGFLGFGAILREQKGCLSTVILFREDRTHLWTAQEGMQKPPPVERLPLTQSHLSCFCGATKGQWSPATLGSRPCIPPRAQLEHKWPLFTRATSLHPHYSSLQSPGNLNSVPSKRCGQHSRASTHSVLTLPQKAATLTLCMDEEETESRGR